MAVLGKKADWRRKVVGSKVTKNDYRELKDLYGEKRADRFVELIYTKAKEQNYAGILETEPAVCPVISALMQGEKRAVNLRRGFYQGYMADAKAGTLAQNLNNNLRWETDYYTTPRTNNPTSRDLAVDKAANWICGDYT